jgi:hypothetical protein
MHDIVPSSSTHRLPTATEARIKAEQETRTCEHADCHQTGTIDLSIDDQQVYFCSEHTGHAARLAAVTETMVVSINDELLRLDSTIDLEDAFTQAVHARQ